MELTLIEHGFLLNSELLRKYLDPEKTPLPEDLEILAATEQARKIFDNNLENQV